MHHFLYYYQFSSAALWHFYVFYSSDCKSVLLLFFLLLFHLYFHGKMKLQKSEKFIRRRIAGRANTLLSHEMKKNEGSTMQDLKSQNRLLVLKHIAMQDGISRIDLSRMTGLSKMTVGNIAAELLAAGIVEEPPVPPTPHVSGKRPIPLILAPTSPCICGMLIKRDFCQIILSDLGGKIFYQTEQSYTSLSSSKELLDILENLFHTCCNNTTRRILAIGISCLGPIDTADGRIVSPPNFYEIENVPIVSLIRGLTGLPVFLVNDATAGAFSEKLFGLGTGLANFVYLDIINGIGAGFVLNNTLYNGDFGQSGEIGHTSINLNGPRCICGNRGCLELYANLENMRAHIRELSVFYPDSPLSSLPSPKWSQIIQAGNQRDSLALHVLEEYCSYIAQALTNTLNLLNLTTVIVDYVSADNGTIIEELLERKLNALVISAKYHPISTVHSTFNGNGSLIGSTAFVIDKIFNGNLPLEDLELFPE